MPELEKLVIVREIPFNSARKREVAQNLISRVNQLSVVLREIVDSRSLIFTSSSKKLLSITYALSRSLQLEVLKSSFLEGDGSIRKYKSLVELLQKLKRKTAIIVANAGYASDFLSYIVLGRGYNIENIKEEPIESLWEEEPFIPFSEHIAACVDFRSRSYKFFVPI